MRLFVAPNSLYESKDAEPFPSFEQIESGEGMKTLYRVAFENQLDSIFKYGYNRAYTGSAGGNMYGPGVYCTFNLRDSIKNVKTHHFYGDCIIKMRLLGGFSNFIIFDEQLARETYGDKWLIKQQLQNVCGFSEKDAANIESECKRRLERENYGQRGPVSLYHGRTAPAAHHLWGLFRDEMFKKHGIRGLIYKGLGDGHCALPYDFSAVIPYSVSLDQGKTFVTKFNQNLYDHLKDHADVDFKFGGKYHEVFQSVRGFTIVCSKEGKFNILHNDSETPVSKYWFDNMKGHINSETGEFGFKYKNVDFQGRINIERDSSLPSAYIVDPFDEDSYFQFDNLNEFAEETKKQGYSSFDELLYNMDDEEGEEQNESVRRNRPINEIISGCMFNVLKEYKSTDNNRVSTLTKLCERMSRGKFSVIKKFQKHKSSKKL